MDMLFLRSLVLICWGCLIVPSPEPVNSFEVILISAYSASYSIAMLQAVRALMIVGIVLGVIGLLVSIFALKCIRIGSMEDSAKANMTLTSGIMFIVAGKQRASHSHSPCDFWEYQGKVIVAEETWLLLKEHC